MHKGDVREADRQEGPTVDGLLTPMPTPQGTPRWPLHVQGRVFMTHPTKVIYHTLLKDFAKGAKGSSDEAL